MIKIGRLKPHRASKEDAAKLLAAARRNLRETSISGLSPETRFDLAYKAVMQCGLLALLAHGCRPSTSEPGHHATIIQTLPLTIGLDDERMIVLDKMRRMRNVNDYSGDIVTEEAVAACIRSAQSLLTSVTDWLKQTRTEWTA
ncbi:MAG TPA: hypothetical protein VFN79_03265 [Steroidobacteraceae bacterium]|nr:hypothetical protein [Steroidobacteraceae bacterium]